jgi:hypothetical protein
MFGKRFETELEMIDKALASEQGEKDLRAYLLPYVESVVGEYILENNPNADASELIKAGWTHLGIAIKKYKERTEKMTEGENTIYYFSTYFNWYIRQGIVEYLNSKK